MIPLSASLSTSVTLPLLVALATPRWPTVAGLVVRRTSSPAPVMTGKVPAGKVPETSLPSLRCLRRVSLSRKGSARIV